jgi:hypothetical protein
MKPQRRDFLKNGSIAFVSLAMLTRAAQAPAQAKALPHVAENDPTATALGYRNDATKVDKKKFANWQAGKDCDDCAQFEGKKGETWGPCKIFPGKAVNAHGWCTAFQQKKA